MATDEQIGRAIMAMANVESKAQLCANASLADAIARYGDESETQSAATVRLAARGRLAMYIAAVLMVLEEEHEDSRYEGAYIYPAEGLWGSYEI